MIRLRRIAVSGAALAFTASAVRAQANVNGIAYDSLSHAPLRGATVQLVASDDPAKFSRSAMSDSLGRYAFDAVPDGRYTIGFFHPLLDSLGVSAPAREVFVSGRRAVRADVAIPGPSRMAHAICGAKMADSSGVVTGFARDARTLTPVSGASVTGEWLDLAFSSAGMSRRNPHLTATTGENGWFAICNVPANGSIMLVASKAADTTDRVEVVVPAEGFARRDLYLGGGAREGRVTGIVTVLANNQPLPGAQVSIGATQARAGDDGHWSIGNAPLGTHSIDVHAVGYYPEHRAIDVFAGMPPVTIAMSTMRAVLDTVKVNATRLYSRNLAVFETHRRQGIGTYITREQVQRRHLFKFSDLFRGMNGIRVVESDRGDILQVRGTGEWCSPNIWIDDTQVRDISLDEINLFVKPEEVVGVEVYAGVLVPPQYQSPLGGCGALAIWTK